MEALYFGGSHLGAVSILGLYFGKTGILGEPILDKSKFWGVHFGRAGILRKYYGKFEILES